jgi:glutathione peroxidase
MKLLSLALLLTAAAPIYAEPACPDYLNLELPKLHSKETVNICKVAAGKPLLVINTASHCGYTKQFEGLEKLHQHYKEKGLFVVGFASNDFNQEAQSEEEAARICRHNFGVTFTMIAPSFVTGKRANPIFQTINAQSEAPSWNFNKYIIDAEGTVKQHFSSKVKPDNVDLKRAIESVL